MIRKPAFIALCLVAIIIASATGAFLYIRSQKIIPAQIKHQLDFLVFLPPESQSSHIENKSFKYDANLKVFSVVVTSFNVKNTISEQPTPDAFNDIPGYYDKLTQNLNSYTNFETDLGRVYLTRPEELKGKQSAIMSTKGTLMFASPNKDLTDSQWRQFFNSLSIISN
jgi:hypothetical protein